jgi:hypothetical protein
VHYSDYLREQAAEYRRLADVAEDLAEVAYNIDDRQATG